MRRILPGLLGLAMLCAACGSDEVEPFALVASSNGSIGLGEQRVLFGLVDPETDEFLASPDREATVTIRDENGSPLDTYPMEFIWTIPDVRGLYVAHVNIPEAATYQATIDAEGLATAGPAGFVAFDDPPLIPLVHYVNVVMFDPHKVTGLTSHPRQEQDMSRIDIFGDGKGRDVPLSMPPRQVE